MAFNKTNLGKFGERLPSDMEGYVPEAGDGPWDFKVDHGSEQTHDEEGNLTEYGEWWEEEGFPEWRDAAIKATKKAEQALEKWRAENPSVGNGISPKRTKSPQRFYEEDLPKQFYTPPIDQGQIVEYSYGATPEGVFQRVYDRSDREETYYFVPWSKAKREDEASGTGEPDYWNRLPLVSDKQWKKIAVERREQRRDENPSSAARRLKNAY